MSHGEFENVQYQYKSLDEINDLLSSDPEYPWFYVMRANYNARTSENPEIQSCEIKLIAAFPLTQVKEVIDRMDKFLKNCDNEKDSSVGKSFKILKDLEKARDLEENYIMFKNSLDMNNFKNVFEGRQPKTSFEFEARSTHISKFFPCYFEELDADLSKALEMNPNNFTAMCDQIHERRKHGRISIEAALESYKKLLSINPNSAWIYYGMGGLYVKMNEFSKSERNSTIGIQLLEMSERPCSGMESVLLSNLYYNRSCARNFLRNPSGDFQDLTKANELNPKNFKALNNLASKYRQNKDYQKALMLFNRALKVKNDYVFSFFGRGIVFKALKQYAFAVSDFSRALSNSALTETIKKGVYRMRGQCFLHLEMFEKAILDFTEGAKLGEHPSLRLRTLAVKKLKEKIMKM